MILQTTAAQRQWVHQSWQLFPTIGKIVYYRKWLVDTLKISKKDMFTISRGYLAMGTILSKWIPTRFSYNAEQTDRVVTR